MKKITTLILGLSLLSFMACNETKTEKKCCEKQTSPTFQEKVDAYVPVALKADISRFSDNQKEMLGYLFDAATIMDDLYWEQAFGNKNELLENIANEAEKTFVLINYGPWDRLGDNKPFVKGWGEKPKGANFYPQDLTEDEMKKIETTPAFSSLYTMIVRDDNGEIQAIPYSTFFAPSLEKAATLLKKASELAEDEGFKNYLTLRAAALLSNDYYPSDVAWMNMKDNSIDFVIGPIENYEDQLFGYKTAFESFVLLKDMEWSNKLNRYASLLPALQTELPCAPKYKAETPGLSSDLGAYEVVYYQGDCNAGSKTIAINLPNDEKVRANEGSRKLQLKNSMQAKFDKILVPIANELMDPEQLQYVKFDAFFENTMFHEVAHGLGMGTVCAGDKTVREALKDTYTSLEEGKADIVGLWCVSELFKKGEIKKETLMDNYVTFFAGIFRSVRFGAASAHGKANMMRFYYFEEAGAFERNAETGKYRVNFEKMQEAVNSLSNLILTIQGDGDYAAAKKMLDEKGFIREALQQDLDRLTTAGIPKDVRFIQGKEELGL